MGRWEILAAEIRHRRRQAYVGQARVVIGRDALPTSQSLCRTSRRVRVWSANRGNPPIGKACRTRRPLSQASARPNLQNVRDPEHSCDVVGSMSLPGSREAGVSLVELSVALFLLTAGGGFGFQTLVWGGGRQNTSLFQKMTEADAGNGKTHHQRRGIS